MFVCCLPSMPRTSLKIESGMKKLKKNTQTSSSIQQSNMLQDLSMFNIINTSTFCILAKVCEPEVQESIFLTKLPRFLFGFYEFAQILIQEIRKQKENDPIHEIGFPILGFITILCLKFRPLAFPVESQKSLYTRLKTNYLPQNAETQGHAID